MKQFFLFACLLVSSHVLAQSTGQLEFLASTKQDGKPLNGCEITLFSDPMGDGKLVQLQQLTTKGNAKFSFKLDYNAHYLVKCTKDGLPTKTIKLNTALPKDVPLVAKQFECIVDMVPMKDGATIYTVTTVFYDAARKVFEYKQE
jgi:hypothetical protein